MSDPATVYVVDGYWVDGYTVVSSPQGMVQGPVTVQNVIPSYLYWQYQDDSDLQAFVASFNQIAQNYINTFNQLNLPVYTSSLIVGPLLDWVATGLYGINRPVLSTGSLIAKGVYNSDAPYNTNPYNADKSSGTVTQLITTDDVFKRILTWNLYRGDGKIFNATWLKRRVLRFLNGLNGTDPGIDQTYLVSVTYSGYAITIDLTNYVTAFPSSQMPTTLSDAISSGALNLPFIYTYSVTT